MFGKGGKLSLASVDADISDVLDETLAIAKEFAGELPLVGISVQAMHDAEERGLKLCEDRLAEIKAELTRLTAEAVNTEIILKAGTLKLSSLKSFIKQSGNAQPAQVPPAVHTDIQAGQVSAFDPVETK